MAGNRFDEFSKALATGTPRRTLLKLLVAGPLGGILARMGMHGTAEAVCNQTTINYCVQSTQPGQPGWCEQAFTDPAAKKSCVQQAFSCSGPCFQCGPGAAPGHPDVCAGHCCNAQTPNCCPAQNAANGVCTNVLTDANNCGFCGRVCPTGQTCTNGGCVSAGACGNPSSCPVFGSCGGSCACFTRVDGQGGFCSSLQFCGESCTSNAQCPNGVCIQTCCGNTCAANTSACMSTTIAQMTPAIPAQGPGGGPASNRTTR